jgi:hypothetical protein
VSYEPSTIHLQRQAAITLLPAYSLIARVEKAPGERPPASHALSLPGQHALRAALAEQEERR